MKFNRLNLFYPFVLIVGIYSLYHNVVHNGFSGLDDILMIEENWDRLQHLSHIKTAFTEDVFIRAEGSYYRPIQLLSYMPDVYFSGSNVPVAQIFFQINIFLFMLAFVQLFFFLKEFNLGIHYRFIFTGLMAVHPALTPAVSWIPGRIDTLLFIIVIASFWAFIRFTKSHKPGWAILHLCLFTIGMFTKETAITIPVLSLLLLWFFQTLKQDEKAKENWRWKKAIDLRFWFEFLKSSLEWTKLHLGISIGWISILAVWYFMRSQALSENPLGLMGMLYHLNSSWQEFIILGSVTYFPYHLQVFLDITWYFVVLAIPGFLVFIGVPILLKSKFNYTFLGLIWMFIFILPTTLSDSLNYHRMFIPFVGMAFILQPLSKTAIKRVYLGVSIVFFLILFIVQNIAFQKAYVDKNTFWNNAVTYSPNSPFANNGLAWSYHMDHKNDSALKYYERVVQLRPEGENVRIGMALIHEEMGQIKQADQLLQEEFNATHDSSLVYFFIGQVQLDRGDTQQAVSNLSLGYRSTETSRNSRLYYDTLDVEIKQQLRID